MPGIDRLTIEELVDSREKWWTDQFTDFVWAGLADETSGSILELGCGTGILARRLQGRLKIGSKFYGIDLDLLRLRAAATGCDDESPRPKQVYAAAGGQMLPFADGSFAVSITVLTLQHIFNVAETLAELRRVTRPGGLVVSVEADNLGQRMYLPRPADAFDRALALFWRRVHESCRPSDIAIGPQLPRLYREAALSHPTVATYLVTHVSWDEPGEFVARAAAGFKQLAYRYGIQESPEELGLLRALRDVGRDYATDRQFYTITTIPMFRVSARREAGPD